MFDDGCYCRKCCGVDPATPGFRGWLRWFTHGDDTDWGHYPPPRANARATQVWLWEDVIEIGKREDRKRELYISTHPEVLAGLRND